MGSFSCRWNCWSVSSSCSEPIVQGKTGGSVTTKKSDPGVGLGAARKAESHPATVSANINDNCAIDEGHYPEPKWQEIDSESEMCMNVGSAKSY